MANEEKIYRAPSSAVAYLKASGFWESSDRVPDTPTTNESLVLDGSKEIKKKPQKKTKQREDN